MNISPKSASAILQLINDCSFLLEHNPDRYYFFLDVISRLVLILYRSGYVCVFDDIKRNFIFV